MENLVLKLKNLASVIGLWYICKAGMIRSVQKLDRSKHHGEPWAIADIRRLVRQASLFST